MTFADLVNVLVVLGFVAYVVLEIREGRRRARLSVAAAERLGMQGLVHSAGSMSGTVRGLPLTARFVGGTKSTPQHTLIEVVCAPCAVMLHLRRQTGDQQREVDRRQAVDVTIGDPAFDATWIVEGAPAERVLRVLAYPALRQQLLAFSHVDGGTVAIENGKVTVYRLGTEVGADAIATDRMALAVSIAEAVIADGRTPLGPGGVDASSGDAQIAELARLRAARFVNGLRLPTLVVSSFTTGMFLMVRGIGMLEGVSAIALCVFALFGTVALTVAYRSAIKGVIDPPRDPLASRWMMGCWAINLVLTLGAFAGK